jgi:hypothetical protein
VQWCHLFLFARASLVSSHCIPYNGTEYINKQFMEYYKTNGIIIETTAPHSSAQNGVAERHNRTLLKSTHAMLLAAALLRKFWPEAVSYACHIKNCVPTQALRGMTP